MNEKIQIKISGLNPKQREIFKLITETNLSTKYHILRASRQSGKTFLLLRLIIYFAFCKKNQTGIVVSASAKQFEKLWRDLLKIIPKNLIQNIRLGESLIYFPNGSSVQFFTANNYDAVVGNSTDFLICDEAALYPANALAYLTPLLAAKKEGKAVIASTPRGKNEFYENCMVGMDETQDFYRHYRMSYLDNSNYDMREVELKKKTMPDSVFRSEYLAEFVFGKSAVFGNFSQYQTVTSFSESVLGESYYGGLDVSGTGEDKTILTILNSKGIPVCIYECVSESMPSQADELAPIINKYNATVLVECNGLGIGLYDILELRCKNIHKFWQTNENKNELVNSFIKDLFDKNIQLPTIDLYYKLDSEMSSYMVTRTATGKLQYNASDTHHDDTVISMMIANKCRNSYVNGTELATYAEDRPINSMPTYNEMKEYYNGNYDYDE